MWHADGRGEAGVRRAALIVTAAGSLLLCVGTAVVWMRSYHTMTFHFGPNRWEMTTVTVRDGTLIWYGPHEKTSPLTFEYALWRVPAGVILGWAGVFVFRRLCNAGGLVLLFILVNGTACALGSWPAFPIVDAFDLLVLVHAVRQVMRRRAGPDGFCKNCGYDLRATPNRCPECGTAAATKAPI